MKNRSQKENRLRTAIREHCLRYRVVQADLTDTIRSEYALFIERLIGELRHLKGLPTT